MPDLAQQDLTRILAGRLHAAESPHWHLDPDQPHPCRLCIERATLAVKVLAQPDGFLTPKEFADRLHLSRRTVYRGIRSRQIRAVQIGSRYQIPAWVAAWYASQAAPSDAARTVVAHG